MVMQHKPVAIVAAMRTELAPLLRGIPVKRVNGVELFELQNAVVAIGGIGRSAGVRAAEVAIAEAQPQILVAAGIAGAVSPRLKVGEVAQAREVVDAENGDRYAAQGGDWLVATAPCISDAVGKKALWEQFGADVVDMEGAAVASVAKRHGIKFAAVKAVSDQADFPMPPLMRFLGPAGNFVTGRFLVYLMLHPRWWGPVMKLSSNSRRASMNLSRELGHLIEQYSNLNGREEAAPGLG
jgi:adenosylhomocysteine nucleosidase